MSSILLFLLASLLSTSQASPAPTQQTNLIQDGSFENISSSYGFQQDFTAGDWTFQNDVTLITPRQDDGYTPYGQNYVAAFTLEKPQQAVLSQDLAGLVPGQTYTYNYAYAVIHSPAAECVFKSSIGGQLIDRFQLPASTTSGWQNRTVTFAPRKSSGTFVFFANCPPIRTKDYSKTYEWHYDAFSIVKATN